MIMQLELQGLHKIITGEQAPEPSTVTTITAKPEEVSAAKKPEVGYTEE